MLFPFSKKKKNANIDYRILLKYVSITEIVLVNLTCNRIAPKEMQSTNLTSLV